MTEKVIDPTTLIAPYAANIVAQYTTQAGNSPYRKMDQDYNMNLTFSTGNFLTISYMGAVMRRAKDVYTFNSSTGFVVDRKVINWNQVIDDTHSRATVLIGLETTNASTISTTNATLGGNYTSALVIDTIPSAISAKISSTSVYSAEVWMPSTSTITSYTNDTSGKIESARLSTGIDYLFINTGVAETAGYPNDSRKVLLAFNSASQNTPKATSNGYETTVIVQDKSFDSLASLSPAYTTFLPMYELIPALQSQIIIQLETPTISTAVANDTNLTLVLTCRYFDVSGAQLFIQNSRLIQPSKYNNGSGGTTYNGQMFPVTFCYSPDDSTYQEIVVPAYYQLSVQFQGGVALNFTSATYQYTYLVTQKAYGANMMGGTRCNQIGVAVSVPTDAAVTFKGKRVVEAMPDASKVASYRIDSCPVYDVELLSTLREIYSNSLRYQIRKIYSSDFAPFNAVAFNLALTAVYEGDIDVLNQQEMMTLVRAKDDAVRTLTANGLTPHASIGKWFRKAAKWAKSHILKPLIKPAMAVLDTSTKIGGNILGNATNKLMNQGLSNLDDMSNSLTNQAQFFPSPQVDFRPSFYQPRAAMFTIERLEDRFAYFERKGEVEEMLNCCSSLIYLMEDEVLVPKAMMGNKRIKLEDTDYDGKKTEKWNVPMTRVWRFPVLYEDEDGNTAFAGLFGVVVDQDYKGSPKTICVTNLGDIIYNFRGENSSNTEIFPHAPKVALVKILGRTGKEYVVTDPEVPVEERSFVVARSALSLGISPLGRIFSGDVGPNSDIIGPSDASITKKAKLVAEVGDVLITNTSLCALPCLLRQVKNLSELCRVRAAMLDDVPMEPFEKKKGELPDCNPLWFKSFEDLLVYLRAIKRDLTFQYTTEKGKRLKDEVFQGMAQPTFYFGDISNFSYFYTTDLDLSKDKLLEGEMFGSIYNPIDNMRLCIVTDGKHYGYIPITKTCGIWFHIRPEERPEWVEEPKTINLMMINPPSCWQPDEKWLYKGAGIWKPKASMGFKKNMYNKQQIKLQPKAALLSDDQVQYIKHKEKKVDIGRFGPAKTRKNGPKLVNSNPRDQNNRPIAKKEEREVLRPIEDLLIKCPLLFDDKGDAFSSEISPGFLFRRYKVLSTSRGIKGVKASTLTQTDLYKHVLDDHWVSQCSTDGYTLGLILALKVHPRGGPYLREIDSIFWNLINQVKLSAELKRTEDFIAMTVTPSETSKYNIEITLLDAIRENIPVLKFFPKTWKDTVDRTINQISEEPTQTPEGETF